MRNLVRETRLNPAQFVLPLFVCPGEGVKREISSMPLNYQMSIDEIVKECAEVEALGIGAVILFGLPETKDEMATGALVQVSTHGSDLYMPIARAAPLCQHKNTRSLAP